ncbi:Protein SQS1 like protein [Verticillium longisporum]|nr:Protein SQS1 like protein [Verticillium longisporum]
MRSSKKRLSISGTFKKRYTSLLRMPIFVALRQWELKYCRQTCLEAILADYIANMRENGDDLGLITSQGHAKRDIGGSDMDMHVENDLQSAQNDDKSGLSGDAASLAGSSKSIGDLDALDYESKQREPHTRLTDSDFLLAQMLAAGEATDAYSSQDDEYDDLDFMEWGDPITKRTRKPKKGKLPVFNVSDSELEAVLLSTYNNDRLKKAERKKDREKLRAQGLLGKKGKPEDLRIKYPQGIVQPRTPIDREDIAPKKKQTIRNALRDPKPS